ncbi:hypothetical protein Q9233_013621 [Columba guinea]|nr:hypothetical protein Q9233_013621 [Columba guinea]
MVPSRKGKTGHVEPEKKVSASNTTATAFPFTHHVSMALKVKTAETKVLLSFFILQVVLVNLLICMVVFYTVYYVVLSVCFAVFKIKMLDGLAPFDFKTNPSWINPYYLVLVISLEITFFICGLLFALVVEEWVWDYAVTVTIVHIIITSVVMSEFPLMLHWWLALGGTGCFYALKHDMLKTSQSSYILLTLHRNHLVHFRVSELF